jgi:hypothetical protein
MSRKILLDTAYTFTPSTRTIVIPEYLPRERLILITNVVTNQVIYNFSDPALNATSYTAAIHPVTADETTTIVLKYNTALMSSTDKLQITIDEYEERFAPAETLLDPVNKLRVSQPEALIDTDFEFGVQTTKWENLGLVNNRPSAYSTFSLVPNITAMAMGTGSAVVTVTTSAAHGLTVGLPITITDAVLSIANGNYTIESVPSTTTFTYSTFAQNPYSVTAIFDQYKTAISRNLFYSGSQIGGAPTAMSYNGTSGAVTVTTSIPHCLVIGNEISVLGTTASTNAPNGNYTVASILNPTQFVYYTTNIPTGTLVFSSAQIYPRPQSSFVHRPFDGGVFFSSNGSSANQQAIRQTRRYFRYQSGKGIQLSSGTVLKPTFQIDSLTSSGTTVTVITKERHNLQPGVMVTVSGANETGYNGTYTVTDVISPIVFKYTAATTPTAAQASGNYAVAVANWYGATNRLGMFDHQNGVFWEFDGQTLSVGKRSSTYQLAGKISVTNASNTVTQTDALFPTSFSKQLEIGDFVVIRGQSYRIQDIASDTSMTISPDYRGPSGTFINMSKTVDIEVPQSQFNIDKLDGTGPSGYTIDLTKMQMFYIDFTWYGAGFVRYGIRGPQGDVIYVHKTPNNNVNSEAYMRSGNLPARYESSTLAVSTKVTSTITTGAVAVAVTDTSKFPPAGTLCIRNGTVYEYVNYTGKTATSFTGIIREQAGAAAQVVSATVGSVTGTVSANTGIQVGQRVVSVGYPDTTYVAAINGTTLTFSQAATALNPTVLFAPMGAGSAQNFVYSATDPITIELAFPSFGPAINHWGTSVIMDGRFDDDKSLVFTYGQTNFTSIPAAVTLSATNSTGAAGSYSFTVASASGIRVGMSAVGVGIPLGASVTSIVSTTVTINLPLSSALSSTPVTFSGGNSKALFSIRVAPSVDNGQTSIFGGRELVNRMQLTLDALGVSTKTASANMLVRLYINGTVNTSTLWTNAVGNAPGAINSSLAQIADFAAGDTSVIGGEVTGGFFVTGTDRLELTNVRDLGNSIMGGGIGTTANTQVYPDGPDVLTAVVTNLSATAIDVLGRLSWTEAQA